MVLVLVWWILNLKGNLNCIIGSKVTAIKITITKKNCKGKVVKRHWSQKMQLWHKNGQKLLPVFFLGVVFATHC